MFGLQPKATWRASWVFVSGTIAEGKMRPFPLKIPLRFMVILKNLGFKVSPGNLKSWSFLLVFRDRDLSSSEAFVASGVIEARCLRLCVRGPRCLCVKLFLLQPKSYMLHQNIYLSFTYSYSQPPKTVE